MRGLLVGLMVAGVGLFAVGRGADAQVAGSPVPGGAVPGNAAPGNADVVDDGMWRAFRGKVIFSEIALAPTANFDSAATMTSALRRIERSSIDQTGGFWRMHMVAFLDHPAAGDVLLMRATGANGPRQARQVRVFEVPVERGAREVRLDDFVITDGMGFERGGSYEMSLEAPPEEASPAGETKKAGKADVYAKGMITLR